MDGQRVQVSVGKLVNAVETLRSQVKANDTVDPKAVISIGDLSWKNTACAIKGLYALNPQGKGLAAFSGLTRCWAFAMNSDNTTVTALTSMAKAQAVGLTGQTEAAYLTACGSTLPTVLGGSKITHLGVNTCLPLFESRAGYFGSGMGDGARDRFLSTMRDCLADERMYALDSLASGPLLEAALTSIQVVETFVTMFLGHSDNMIHQMTEAQMADKQIMILCSRIMFMLWETVLPHHRAVAHVGSSNKGLLTAAAAVATFQEVAVMREYIVTKFVDHPKINNCFIRFLTVHSVKSNPTQQLSKVEIKALVTKEAEKLVSQIKAASETAGAAKASAEKTFNKLTSIISRNDLKTGGK